MPGKRATTPLFEVLQERQAAARAEPRPEHAADEAPHARPEPRPAPNPTAGGFTDAPIRIVGGVVQMPMVYAAAALAIAMASVLGAWTIGFRRGEDQALRNQQLLETVLDPQARITEPGRSAQPANTDTNNTTPRSQPQPNRSTPQIGAADYLTSSGLTRTNPRQDRHNYLQLGSSIRPAEMQSIIDLMTSRDLDCFGVVESGSRRRNDGPLYVLFASRGFPSGEANSEAARRYREQVLAAGAAWKQAGGVKNFNDAVWVLYRD